MTGASASASAADDFTEHVFEVVEAIPPGRVMSYGQVAATFGSRSSRGVGRVMALYGHALPWWRVVQASGRPPSGHDDAALERYEEEGTPLVASASGYRVARSAFL